jgi:hypothetical protein
VLVNHRSAILLALVLSLGCIRLAHAQMPVDAQEDFADEVRKVNGYNHRGWVIDRMITFKVGDACWERMLDNKNRAITIANLFARSVARYAEKLTSENWERIEGTGTQEREKNKHLVEELLEKLRPDLHLTIIHDGPDCDVAGNDSLFLKYWNTIGTTLVAHPPNGGRAIVLLHVTPKVKDVTVEVTQDGTKFAITAPSERDVIDWHQKITKPFQKASRK